MPELLLKPDRDYSVTRRHPWIFSGAVDRVTGDPQPGETVDVRSADGTLLGRGAWSGESQMRVRLWSFNPEEVVDAAFFANRLAHAIAGRGALLAANATNAFRLVNAEADGLPGVIVDRYDAFLVCQFTTAGAERWKPVIGMFVSRQTTGVVAAYAQAIRDVAAAGGAALADVYAKWEAFEKSGVDVTLRLCNGINHPDAGMHDMAAQVILEAIERHAG